MRARSHRAVIPATDDPPDGRQRPDPRPDTAPTTLRIRPPMRFDLVFVAQSRTRVFGDRCSDPGCGLRVASRNPLATHNSQLLPRQAFSQTFLNRIIPSGIGSYAWSFGVNAFGSTGWITNSQGQSSWRIFTSSEYSFLRS